jgi:hypothetical protein
MGFFGGGSSVDLASPPAIGSTTPNTGAFTTLSFAPPANSSGLTSTSYSVTGSNSTNLVSMSGTWNTTGTPKAILVNITNTASNFDSRLIDLQASGTSRFWVRANGEAFFGGGATEFNAGMYQSSGSNIFGIQNGFASISSTSGIRWSSTSNWQASHDLFLLRDGAAGTLAQRNSTSAQTFRLYNTFTDASNYERGFFRWASNVLEIGTEAAGTGTQRQLRLPLGTVTASTPLSVTQTWSGAGVTFTGIQANITDTASASASLLLDLQTGGTSRARIDKSGNMTALSYTCIANSTLDGIISRQASMYGGGDANGTWVFQNSNFNNFNMLKLGGSTSSFPSLKRSSAILQVRLADDSGYTTLDAQIRLQGTAPATTGATGTAGDVRYDSDYIYICTAANTWKRVAIATW